jgi:hypothetical protein
MAMRYAADGQISQKAGLRINTVVTPCDHAFADDTQLYLS